MKGKYKHSVLWKTLLVISRQPDATNGYPTGAVVTHGGSKWQSLVDNNVWEPGAAGTETLWQVVDE